ncbi:hypothetical protein [Maribacter aquivivus]|uniref:hypothetical protein n=1 Tax=Maribacter aquivivus TaxID=228958 RepID=UPI00249300E8|nr:hypothetical protein [Maribacter aquivivus]
MKYLPLYFLFLIFGTCFGQSSELDFKTYFTENEIKDLNTIADFFQSELCGTKDRKEFGKCIRDLVPKIVDLERTYIPKNINYRKQKKLYRTISKNTFNKIWGLCKTWRTNEPKYEYESLCFSSDPDFINFVLDLGKTSGYLSRYAGILELGGLGNSNFIASNILEFPKSMNIDDRGVQVVFAIHYLTRNDNLKRDKKAIRLENRDLIKLNRKIKKKTVPNNG